jgi:hypothetical protein
VLLAFFPILSHLAEKLLEKSASNDVKPAGLQNKVNQILLCFSSSKSVYINLFMIVELQSTFYERKGIIHQSVETKANLLP